jgi:hypothetical protein
MSEQEGQEPETREFHLPITVTVGDRQVEVPLSVHVTFDQLAFIVEGHLSEGLDVYGQLLELYAESVSPRKKGKGRTPASSQVTPQFKQGQAPSASGGRSQGKPTAWDGYSKQELEEARTMGEPTYSGRGRKSPERKLWEATQAWKEAGEPEIA